MPMIRSRLRRLLEPALGTRSNLIYTDHGLTGTNRARPGLREALAACRDGDTLVVAKLDRLARPIGYRTVQSQSVDR